MEINVSENKIEILVFWWPFWKLSECKEVNVCLMPLIKIWIVYHMLIYSAARLKLLYSSSTVLKLQVITTLLAYISYPVRYKKKYILQCCKNISGVCWLKLLSSYLNDRDFSKAKMQICNTQFTKLIANPFNTLGKHEIKKHSILPKWRNSTM